MTWADCRDWCENEGLEGCADCHDWCENEGLEWCADFMTGVQTRIWKGVPIS